MKKLLPLILTLALMQNFGFCQDKNSEINNRFTEQSLFLFNSFEEGIAFFKDGGIAKANYNYNVVNNEFCYLKNSNILIISNIEELDSIIIGDKIFYYIDNKILETICSNGITVFLNRKANIPSNAPSGAYGTPSNTSSVSKKTSYYSDRSGDYVNLHNENDQEIPVSEKLYLLIDDELIFATKIRIYKKFKDHKSNIKSFIKENNINLQNRKDLIELASFLEKFI
ncbi:MAG: hypothetical protein ACLFVR_06295 [Thiohalospira sp.]